MEIAGYLGVIGAGVTLGLIGGGGSILIMPILLYLFYIEPVMATTYSLFIVGLASIVGVLQYFRSKQVDFSLGLTFLLPSSVGVLSSRLLILPNLPAEVLAIGDLKIGKDLFILLVFASMMLSVSISMIRRKKPVNVGSLAAVVPAHARGRFALRSFGIGLLTGFVGAGGGFLIVPALVILAKTPIKTAVGTSLFIISVNSLIGFLGDAGKFGVLDWNFLLIVAFLMSVGILLGKYLSRFVPSQKLEPAFGWFVLIVGLFMLIKQFASAFA